MGPRLEPVSEPLELSQLLPLELGSCLRFLFIVLLLSFHFLLNFGSLLGQILRTRLALLLLVIETLCRPSGALPLEDHGFVLHLSARGHHPRLQSCKVHERFEGAPGTARCVHRSIIRGLAVVPAAASPHPSAICPPRVLEEPGRVLC